MNALPLSSDQLVALFAGYARGVGATVLTTSSADEVAAAIAAAAGGQPIRFVAAVRDAFPDVYTALLDIGLDLSSAEEIAAAQPGRSETAAALAGGVGVVVARAAVAETGSVVLADDALAPRLLGMLADTCVALLPAAALLPDLDAAAVLLAQLEAVGHRYVSLVTGPSRTADIERVLTIGVQGPKALLVIVVK